MAIVERISLQAAMRAAAVSLLTEFREASFLSLQVNAGRPSKLFPPSAFVDRLSETVVYPSSVTFRQRTVRCEVVVVFGLFDSKEAATQKDRFVDEFLDWVTDRYHEAGPNTTIGIVAVEDDPAWVPDWHPANFGDIANPSFYATRITLEGFAGG